MTVAVLMLALMFVLMVLLVVVLLVAVVRTIRGPVGTFHQTEKSFRNAESIQRRC
ncbi:MAG: hypothetical protein L0H96_10420 [Humibacillus sp.]|nr:hypothetical protein [Humibacillus sp.]MDN5777316.1 hypothetical protein [Humibacillus sp.]